MTNEDIAVELKDHENQIKSLKHRMNEQEEKSNVLTELVTSVKVLANNMEHMAKEQEEQGKRLESLEHEPAETSKYYKRLIIGCILTTVVGGAVGYFISMIIGG